MDQENASIAASNVHSLGGKSWTAYIGTVILTLILMVLVAIFGYANIFGGLLIFALALPLVLLRFFSIKSYHLYMNDDGVWVFRGIFPWSKGVIGVKWRDLDEATFTQSLFSWMFKSYSIRIGHRYTKTSEILLSSWNHGDKAVVTINTKHKELVKANALN